MDRGLILVYGHWVKNKANVGTNDTPTHFYSGSEMAQKLRMAPCVYERR